MKIGIFGGTFNPPHNGHVRMAEKVAEELELDKTLIIPNKMPTHKRCEELATNDERFDMCKLVFTNEKFELSRIEMDRPSDSYMILTLNQLRKIYPDAEFYLIIGSDMFLMLHKWYKYKEIMEQCNICVCARNNEDTLLELRKYAFDKLGIYIKDRDGKNIHISTLDAYEVSSTDIRERTRDGRSVFGLCSPQIIEYMESHKLYGYRKKW